MSDIDETTSEVDSDYPEDEIFDAEWDLEPEPDEPPRGPEPEATGSHRREYDAILAVVRCMNEYGLRLDTLAHAICYGNPLCTAEPDSKQKPVKSVRNELMKSLIPPKILNNLHTPPLYTGSRPLVASKTLDRWVWDHTIRLARAELNQLAANERQEELQAEDPTEQLTDFENMRFSNFLEKTKKRHPILCNS